MTDQERNQILKMIEEGRITPEEGLTLMQALGQSPAGQLPPLAAAAPAPENEPPQGQPSASNFTDDPRIKSLKATVRRFWQIPLWAGIAITIASALGMYAIMRGPGMNFWFYFFFLPLLLGVAVIALAVGSRQARWIYVDVHQEPGARPEHIFLGFPLPLALTAWFLRTFGPMIPELRRTNINAMIELIETGFSSSEPLIVNVDEGNNGNRVRVLIG